MHLSFFSFTVTAPTEIYTLSLHDALPISPSRVRGRNRRRAGWARGGSRGDPRRARADPAPGLHARRGADRGLVEDRKSTRLNSSHPSISYAVFCLKKKKKINNIHTPISYR